MTRNTLAIVLVFSCLFLIVYSAIQYISFSDYKLHLVFCDVGQGDGIFIRTASGKTILVDGGPNEKVLGCISSQMPFWQRSIDMVILSHPHTDHYIGLISVMEKYTVKSFVTEKLSSKAVGFKRLLDTIKQQNIPIQYVAKGDNLKLIDTTSISILGPSISFLNQTSPDGMIGESSEFASLEVLFTYNNFNVLLTGDSQATELTDALQNSKKNLILHVPHHGSSTGLSESIIDYLHPSVAVISVGKKNRYNHPSPFTISLLKDKHIPILRTDQNGTIEIMSDGTEFRVM